jgi:hypothetical protein
MDVPRSQAERTFAWGQKKYRRLVVRWERRAVCFNRFWPWPSAISGFKNS